MGTDRHAERARLRGHGLAGAPGRERVGAGERVDARPHQQRARLPRPEGEGEADGSSAGAVVLTSFMRD